MFSKEPEARKNCPVMSGRSCSEWEECYFLADCGMILGM
jgi:hypothetical protein